MPRKNSNTGEVEVLENESEHENVLEGINPEIDGIDGEIPEWERAYEGDNQESATEPESYNPTFMQSVDEATAFVKARMFRKSVITEDGDKLRVLIVVGRTCVADFYAEGNAENETRKDVSGLFSTVGDTVVTETYTDAGFKIKSVMWNSLTGEIAPIS